MDEQQLHRVREVMSGEPAVLTVRGTILVAGDTHGDVVVSREVVKKFFREDFDHLVFLGDYIDRAPADCKSSRFNMDFLLEEKLTHPEELFLLKGNHEAVYAIPCHPHEFRNEAGGRYEAYLDVFREMPLAAMLNNVFAAHGGILTEGNLHTIDKNDVDAIEALTWSDPAVAETYRGAGIPFDGIDLQRFLQCIGARAFIRGHDYAMNGIIVYEGCLTIFSSRRYRDRGNGGILVAHVDGTIRDIDDISVEEFRNGEWIPYTPRRLDHQVL